MARSRSEPYDVLVVGAGPAGLAAAAAAVGGGARVAVVDAGERPGGQYWRQPSDAVRAGPGRLAADLQHDGATYDRLTSASSRAEWYAGRAVWAVTRSAGGFEVHTVARADGVESRTTLSARRLVLAPGAHDRQLPFPGWDLPGVMGAGGVQALLKEHGVVAGTRVLIAGTGPFLLSVAAGLTAAGSRVVGVHEAASGAGWARHPLALARNPAALVQGLDLARTLTRHRVPLRRRSVVTAAHGDESVSSATVGRLGRDSRVVPGSERRVVADLIAVGWGFTPQLELPLALGCATHVDVDGSQVCTVDDDQRTSVGGVWVAGEACGVGGAALAVVEGEIAGSAAAGVAVPARARRRRTAARVFAVALHHAHPVAPGWVDRVTDETLVCRCEEVTAGRLRAAVDELGADSARSAKLLVRAGMGWCQGRVCGYAASCLVAARTGGPPSPPLTERPVAAPLSLGALADDT
jgi:thioredoxin reductase